MKRIAPSKSGFTLIEVLIVLAIASLIMIIVFLTVPAFKRAQRNEARKRFASLIYAQLETYAENRQGQLPFNANGSVNTALETEFETKYLDSALSSFYDVNFQEMMTVNHAQVPNLDECLVTPGHWCNNRFGSTEDPSHPIAGSHISPKYFVVWTQLETNILFCVDNSTAIPD